MGAVAFIDSSETCISMLVELPAPPILNYLVGIYTCAHGINLLYVTAPVQPILIPNIDTHVIINKASWNINIVYNI